MALFLGNFSIQLKISRFTVRLQFTQKTKSDIQRSSERYLLCWIVMYSRVLGQLVGIWFEMSFLGHILHSGSYAARRILSTSL